MAYSAYRFDELKKRHPEIKGFVMIADRDIPGFAKDGDSLYGNCDDLFVRNWKFNENMPYVVTVYLSN